MRYCARCTFPENARPTIIFDEAGICSGCRATEAKDEIDWTGRRNLLEELLSEYKEKARSAAQPYDCIIPVSGGKDSHFQVYTIKEVYGLNPLLVTYNHVFNTPLGVRNLRNLVRQFDCDLIRVTQNPDAIRRIDRYMLKRVGDITWHYHTGIFTVPFQVAVEKNIPLIVWGDHGYSERTGMFRLEDVPEFTKWTRDQYQMRGVQLEEILDDPENDICIQDITPFMFPDLDRMEDIGVRGIYLGNYIKWDHLAQVKFLTSRFDFKISDERRERTFSQFHKIDDHANDVHDYLKYLKFGYGRGTDHSAEEIRAGRMTREQAIDVVRRYDSVTPSSLPFYMNYLGMTVEEFYACVDDQRDPDIWKRDGNGNWRAKDAIHTTQDWPTEVLEAARVPLVPPDDMTFGRNNRHFYYSELFQPMSDIDDRFVVEGSDTDFVVL